MPPIERFDHVELHARLRGVWLRPSPTERHWRAPLRLAEGALGLCVVELSWAPEDPAQRRAFWAAVARDGQLLQGSFDAPGALSSQVLAAVEGLLAEAGIALQGGAEHAG